jgi:hypothetical protein
MGEAMTREGFEQLVRDALAERDRERKARLFDPNNMTAADVKFLARVVEAAGYTVPAEVAAKAEKTVTRARRARKKTEDAAFGEAS